MNLDEVLTKDMIGEMFETRGGQVVCLDEWFSSFRHSACFSDNIARTPNGVRLAEDNSHPKRDIVRHLPRSEYPEYYL